MPIIIDEIHSSMRDLHSGMKETIKRVKERYTWPRMKKNIENVIKQREICQRVKIDRKNVQPLVVTEIQVLEK